MSKSCHERKSTQRVLVWVNKQREKLGLRPLKHLKKGRIGSPNACSIAASLSTKSLYTEVDSINIEVWRGEDAVLNVAPPKYVADWIFRFDEGRYPELAL